MPARKQTKQKETVFTAAKITQMVQAADTAMAREAVSLRDTPHDRLFALLMARFDRLQASRDDYMHMFAAMRRQPPLLAKYTQLIVGSMKAALKQAQVALPEPRLTMQSVGLMTVYALTLHTWEKDTSADLSSTMRILDRNLQHAARAAQWLGFEAH